MKHERVTRLHKIFEDSVHTLDGAGFRFAQDPCEKTGQSVSDHFVEMTNMVASGSGPERAMGGA